jgi:hypothetical protein
VSRAQGRREDLVIAVAPALPGEPDGSLRVGRADDVEVGTRVVRDAPDVRPGAVAAAARREGTGVDVPVAVALLRPGDVDGPLAVNRDGRPPDVEASVGDVQRGVPGLAVEPAQLDAVAVLGRDEQAMVGRSGRYAVETSQTVPPGALAATG